ncbi:MAG: ArgR family transcriptional regulator, partial [Acidobacteriota bacterium]
MKTQRHQAIRDLLVTSTVSNQDELRRKLAGRGIHVTQATLSRDIRQLKLLKGPAGYALPVTDEE